MALILLMTLCSYHQGRTETKPNLVLLPLFSEGLTELEKQDFQASIKNLAFKVHKWLNLF